MKRRNVTVGSVCSGIGAPEVAWASFGWDYLWSSDIEPFPNAVRAAHFQGVPNLGAMTTIAPRILAGEIEAPDIFVGGTPCQSFSVAGLRKGLADDRGNLALEFIRLADAIDAVRRAAGKPPAWVLWENVPGVLSDSGNAFGAFLAGLVGGDAALVPRGRWTDAGVVDGPGRCAAWRILDAQFFGLAQRRERVFVLARGGAGAWAAADALLPVIESVRWHPAPRREAREAVAGGAAHGACGGGGESLYAPPPIGRCLTNHSARIDGESETFVTHTLRAEGYDASEDGTGRGTPLVPVAATLPAGGHPHSNAPGRRKEDDTNLVAQPMTFDWQAGGGGKDDSFRGKSRSYITDKPGRTRALTAAKTLAVAHAFDARQSDVIQYGDKTGPLDTDGSSIGVLAFDTTQITSAQNRSNPKPGDPCHPLAAGAHAPSAAFDIHGVPATAGASKTDVHTPLRSRAPSGSEASTTTVAMTGMAVRRLTPGECEALQGFPPNHTAITYRGKPAADGPRYRALGNSMAVPVMRWIGEQIRRHLDDGR